LAEKQQRKTETSRIDVVDVVKQKKIYHLSVAKNAEYSMAKKIPKRFYLYSGYGGGVKAGIVIGEEHNGMMVSEIDKLKARPGYKPAVTYVIDIEDIEKIIMHLVETKGYTIGQTKRQKYPRIKINTSMIK